MRFTGGDRVGVPPLALELGGTSETVTVTAEAAMIQTQSGERSFAILNQQISELPVTRGNFTSVVGLTPGVIDGGASAGGTRLGGASQNNIMMDGISAMDTGNNGQMLSMNIESIGEVKVLTQGYQAEYGRSERVADHCLHQRRHEPIPRVWSMAFRRTPTGMRSRGRSR